MPARSKSAPRVEGAPKDETNGIQRPIAEQTMGPQDPSRPIARARQVQKDQCHTRTARRRRGQAPPAFAHPSPHCSRSRTSGQLFSSRCQKPATKAGGNQKTEFRRRKTLPASSFWILASDFGDSGLRQFDKRLAKPKLREAIARLRPLGYGAAASAAPQRRLVEPDGIEPTTSCLQSRRSPN